MIPRSELAAVDLFCGAGGMSLGLRGAGIAVNAGIDWDARCAFPYAANTGGRFLRLDVRTVGSDEVAALFGRARLRLLAGCPPCQPFSTLTQRYDFSGRQETDLLRVFGRLVTALEPEFVAMENVPGMARTGLFREFVFALLERRYHVRHEIVDAASYGLPQRRRRLILLASRLGEPVLEPPSGRVTTLREAIGHLPPIEPGVPHPEDPLHVTSGMTPLTLARVRATPPGGGWRDWPDELRLACYKRPSGLSFAGVFSRLVWDAPAPTLTGSFYRVNAGPYVHPEQDRGLSLREGAILQGFPREFRFVPEGERVRLAPVGRMIGNAVPPPLGAVVGRSLVRHLEEVAA
ncbi:MAG: DNA cytosine methyltransferase [Elioraea sp.]|nr:DNA cytosine methyltransferase [Elioraea sp.]